MASPQIQLSPSQEACVEALETAASTRAFLQLWAWSGAGRTTMLAELQRRLGGTLIRMSDVVDAAQAKHPLALEDAVYATIRDAFAKSSKVFVDDWQLLHEVVNSCGSYYPRTGFLETVSAACETLVLTDPNRRLIIATEGRLTEYLGRRAYFQGVGEFTAEDYSHLCREFGMAADAPVEIEKIHRFAPRLNAYQLHAVCTSCQRDQDWTTEAVLTHLSEEHLVSNVALPEVVETRFEDLIGMDDLIEKLLANVVFPLENDELAQKYGLRAKRGVLLLGPPGTGKTTIGKALAHRLRGKFFLIDGTVISGTDHFYNIIERIIRQAKDNAPAVVFIDDSDVIFENQQAHGLYRYLLTVLDGLESHSLERVCIMMTAMELKHIPPALIRSGRVELWLETQPPDLAARMQHLRYLTRDLPDEIRQFDEATIAEATARCTPADLKRLVNDAKTSFAWAEHHGHQDGDFTSHLLGAIDRLNEIRALYAQVRQTQEHRSDRPVWFDVTNAISENGN